MASILDPAGSSEIFFATAASVAPVEIPAKIPSSFAILWAKEKASSFETFITPSSMPVIQIFRNKSCPDALQGIRPGLATADHR